jgi:hypothetical protein
LQEGLRWGSQSPEAFTPIVWLCPDGPVKLHNEASLTLAPVLVSLTRFAERQLCSEDTNAMSPKLLETLSTGTQPLG